MTNGVSNIKSTTTLPSAPKVSIIVPIFNEEESLPPLYTGIRDEMEKQSASWEIVFVDDGSSDGSWPIMRAIAGRDDRVQVIKLRRNFGQTPALTAGFDHAHGDVIITMDGDMQNDPADIPMLLAEIDKGFDIVSGWRKDRKDPTITKALPSKLSNKLASWLTGVSLHDYGCTLKAYKKEVIESINLYGELHRYIPAVASSIGVKVSEVEVKHHARNFGTSKYGAGRLVRGLLDLLTVKLLLTYMSRPMQMFGGMGIFMVLMGSLLGFTTILMRVFLHMNMTGNPLLYLSILSLIVSVQFISMGFLGEVIIRIYHESQHKPIYVVQDVAEEEIETVSA